MSIDHDTTSAYVMALSHDQVSLMKVRNIGGSFTAWPPEDPEEKKDSSPAPVVAALKPKRRSALGQVFLSWLKTGQPRHASPPSGTPVAGLAP